jgi:S1-C subfamily serine protease
MPPPTVSCPACRTKLLPPAQTAPGQRLRCPTCGQTFLPFDLAVAVQLAPLPLRYDEPAVLAVEPVEEAAPGRETPVPVRKPAGCGMHLLVALLLGGGFLLAVGGGGLLVLFWLDRRPTAGTSSTTELVVSKSPPAQPVAIADREANPAKQPRQPPAAPPEGAGQQGPAVLGGADAPSIPLQTLTAIKAATVFIKVEAGALGASGSGFVVKSEGETAYVVTNHHVIEAPTPGLPFISLLLPPPPKNPTITLVFGSGTGQERLGVAEVVADDEDDDLAVLKVKRIKDVPRPINLRANDKLVETMGLFIFGFPLGSELATNKGNPAITVSKGAVSSIRRNEVGELSVVQIDGEINPGNSGGPVVDGEGRLVGVTVAKVRGTNIGMAIPARALARLIGGRVGETTATALIINNEPPQMIVEAQLIDPLGNIQSVAVHYVRFASLRVQLKPDARGQWPPLPGAEKVQAAIEGQRATAKLPVKPPEKLKDTYAIQVSYVNGEGETVFLQPRRLKPQEATPGGAGDPEQMGVKPPAQAVPPQPPKEERVAPVTLFAAGPREYLSDLKEIDVRAGPWPLSKNGLIGPEKNPIAVGGARSPKGLGLHPPDRPGYAAARYRLGKQAAVFKAAVALNDTAQLVASQAVFEVYGDDKRLWQSAPVGKGVKAQECSVDVSGVDVLELRVTSQGSHFGLHAVWLEPRLLQKADTPDEK